MASQRSQAEDDFIATWGSGRGSIAVGEIGARPPGAQISEITGLIHGFSTHKICNESSK